MRMFRPGKCIPRSDSDGDSPLHFAAASGRNNLIKKYLSLGWEINSTNNLGWTPLMQATRNGHLTCVKLLIQSGADPTFKNRYGVCALSLAVASGNFDIVCLILRNVQQKLIINFTEKKCNFPLFFSILFGNIDILKFLLNQQFDLHEPVFIKGLVPLEFAKILDKKEIMAFLKRSGKSPTNFSINFSNTYRDLNNSPTIIPNTPSSKNPSIPTFTLYNNHSGHLETPKERYAISPIFLIKKRHCSNISVSSVPPTPNLSPVMRSCSPTFTARSNCFSNGLKNNSNNFLNTRFSISPSRLTFSSTDSNESSMFFTPEKLDQIDKKFRSVSCSAPINKNTEKDVEDDVFINSPKLPAPNTKLDDNIIKQLRQHSVDTCVSILEKNEVDLDLFFTLSKNALEEMEIDWEKRDAILEMIYKVNNNI